MSMTSVTVSRSMRRHTCESVSGHTSMAKPGLIGIGIFNAEGVCCYGTNTDLEDLKAERILGDADAVFAIDSLDLVEGTYKLDVAVHKADGYPYDYHRLLHTFRVKSRTKDVGIYRPKHSWQFSAAMTFTGPDKTIGPSGS